MILPCSQSKLSHSSDVECTEMSLRTDTVEKKDFLHLTMRFRYEIKPTPKLSLNIHYQNYGHHGLFPVITSRLAQYKLPIG